MGKAGIPLFGDSTKAELEKEIERITAEINKLYEQRTELEVALASYDSTSEG